MTPKEKAEELIQKYLNTPINFPYIDTQDGQCIGAGYMTHKSAIQCAIIAVDEILKQFNGLHKPEYCAFDAIGNRKFTFEGESPEHMTGYDMVCYWETVKQELLKL
jgi:hypothetical protein